MSFNAWMKKNKKKFIKKNSTQEISPKFYILFQI